MRTFEHMLIAATIGTILMGWGSASEALAAELAVTRTDGWHHLTSWMAARSTRY
jgi:hypothetical protein